MIVFLSCDQTKTYFKLLPIIKMENKNLILNDGGVEALNSNDASENNYLSEISEAFGYSKEYMDAMQRNYPDMTRAEIIEKIE